MKKTLTLLVIFLTVGIGNAQTAPTKQQTVTEINNMLKNVNPTLFYVRGEIYKWHSEYEFSVDDKNDCVLIFDFLLQYTTNQDKSRIKEKITKTIDMSKVKEIYFTLVPDSIFSRDNGADSKGQYAYNYYINFIIVNKDGQNLETISIPISEVWFKGEQQSYEFNKEMKNEKIYKIFNHYRKICGAPEPLSWD